MMSNFNEVILKFSPADIERRRRPEKNDTKVDGENRKRDVGGFIAVSFSGR